ncbi:hypothetical protein LSCM1_06649 [Leishmania martiniquensis]|uniref:Uncharacterized protein n=1 Tax=Leishmania martiniquensis TaxID=1580590 RepID=A0A836HBA8_9TRYP|nr:hypothetical protein LSCM1_06649 [Leishmania martiniquensis]
MPAATDDSTSGILSSAEWLHNVAPCWLDADVPVDVGDVLRELAHRFDRVSAYAQKGSQLPLKAALRVQVMALDCWNATALSGWPAERDKLKAQTRLLVTRLFLYSHCVFSEREVREAHLSHHQEDAEKCILMCLKTSKELLRTSSVDAAEEVLTWAASVVQSCALATGSSVRRFAAEVQFAQLRAAWLAGRHDCACAIAAQLAEETRFSATYKEALFEFIYDTGVKALQETDFSVVLQSKDEKGEVDEGAAALPSGTSAQPSHAVQAALQRLLLLSLRLQGAMKVRTVKQRTFLGMTYLQYAYSLLLCGQYHAAAEAATTSSELLQTLEPIVVRFKAEVYRHDVEKVVVLFRALCDDTAVDVGDLCAMASLAMENIPAVEETLFVELHRRVAASEGATDHFRLLCVLIRHSSEWSVAELLRHLTSGDTPSSTFHRFLFCCLWQLSTKAEKTELRCLSTATRWSCLDVAQRLFGEVASEEELQAVLLDMAHLALALHDDGVEAMLVLDDTLRLLQRLDVVASPLEASLLLVHAQVAFLLGKTEHGMDRVRTLLACTAEATSVHACSELVTFLIRRSLLLVAGSVAELCIASFHEHQSPSCIIEFAKVFAMGSLVDPTEERRAEIGGVLEAHVCPILQHVTLTLPDALWWSRLLWYTAEALLDSNPVRAVRLLHAGVELEADRRDTREPEVSGTAANEILRNRLCLLLDTELDAFAAEQPALSTAELRRQSDRLASLLTQCDDEEDRGGPCSTARQRVTLALARIEAALRAMLERQASTPLDVEALHLAELPCMADIGCCDFEQVAAACHHVATHLSPPDSHYLCDAALNAMLASVKLQLGSAVTSAAGLAAFLATLYAAFKVARDVDGRLRVCEALTEALPCITAGNASLRSSFSRPHPDGGEPFTAHRDLCLCETVVEFFAVEAWNESVQWNVLQRRPLVERWRAVAAALTSVLGDTNASKVAIDDLAAQMPLM